MSVDLVNTITRHQVLLQKFAEGEARGVIKNLTRIRKQVLRRLSMATTEYQQGRLSRLLNDINTIMQIGPEINWEDLAKQEAEWATRLQTDWVTPPDHLLLETVADKPMADGITIDTALRKASMAQRNNVLNTIKDGLALGDTVDVIKKKVNGIFRELNTRQARALTHTIVNHVSNVARMETYATNGVERYEWVATLDSKTTLICGGRDGKVYEIGKGPLPPAHWNCRSTIVPFIEGVVARASLRGPIKRVHYDAWLREQPKEFVDKALGPARSKLFRSGKLKIDKFTDSFGDTYTLEELKNAEAL